jgi:hypothetical protein
MTHDLGVDGPAGRDAEEARLQLSPNELASPHLDGAWWPRSAELTAALPGLVEDLSDRLGEVAFVGYHQSAWTQAPPQMQIGGENVLLQGFTSDEPATIILIGHDGRRVTLRVIATGESEVAAQQQLHAAADDHGDSAASNRAEQVVARSVTEVAAQLAGHEGRADPARTAEIARWCEEAAQQFVNAKVQTFVPILVHHIVHDRMSVPTAAA